MQSFSVTTLRSAIAQRLAEFPVRRADSSDLRAAAVAVVVTDVGPERIFRALRTNALGRIERHYCSPTRGNPA